MKALEKARERRYASVSDLAADIQRHMEHRPVLASPPGQLYRTRKFLRRHRLAALGTAAGVAFIALSGATVWSFARRDSRAETQADREGTIVLADFANKTGDPASMVRSAPGLSVELQQFADPRPDSGRTVSRRCASWGSPEDAKLTPEIAQRSASEPPARRSWRARSQASEANMYWVCAPGTATRETFSIKSRRRPSKKEDVLERAQPDGKQFRTRAGESLPNVKKEPSLRAEVTTPSLEAWRSYSAAMKAAQTRAVGAETRSLLKRAIEIDPKFAMAYAQLGLQRLRNCSGRISQRPMDCETGSATGKTIYITFNYHRQVTGNLELARQTLESWARNIPKM